MRARMALSPLLATIYFGSLDAARGSRTRGPQGRPPLTRVTGKLPRIAQGGPATQGQGFEFALGAPALFAPRPPLTALTRANFVAPAGTASRSLRDGTGTPQVFCASAFEPGTCV